MVRRTGSQEPRGGRGHPGLRGDQPSSRGRIGCLFQGLQSDFSHRRCAPFDGQADGETLWTVVEAMTAE